MRSIFKRAVFGNLKDSSKIILQMIELDLDIKELAYLVEYSESIYDLMSYWERSGYISRGGKE